MREFTKDEVNEICYQIVSGAIHVHKILGPGLLESVYEKCLVKTLRKRGFDVKTQIAFPVLFEGEFIGANLKIDLLVEDIVIVELKAVGTMIPLYSAQLLTYLKRLKYPKGLLINFNCEVITKQLVPIVTDLYRLLP